MKRLCSMALMILILLSILFVLPVSATNSDDGDVTAEPNIAEATPTEGTTEPENDGKMKTSDDLIALLKYEEGFSKYPYWDYSQWTVGYGNKCPDDMLETYRNRGITEYEAELLLREYLANTEWLLNTKIIEKYGLNMTQGQFDALVTFSYNMGTAWITNSSQNIHQQVARGATGNAIIDALSRWCKAGGSVHSVLLRRRLSEARMYIEGVYSHSVPSNYCYVQYNGNGGSTTQSVQGYNPDLPGAVPACVATYGNYTFTGWYTSPTGGEKVETLTQAMNKTTLYAHWAEIEPEEPDVLENPITVKVTTNDVNLRKGPGTNYARIGSAQKGDTFVITQIVETTDYIWGYYGTGWICLQYTTYGEEEPNEPETTDPTEPEGTEPEETEPEEEPVTGKINADPYLCVRQGPGTGYAVVDTLQNGEKVTVLQQKAVGSSIWGQISNGWISMNYVVLDQKDEPEIDQGGTDVTGGKTGTVTCEVLNVRSGAGVNYGIVASYKKNDTVTVTEEKTAGSTTWGKTAKGWVSMDYVKIETDSSNNNQGSSGENPDTTPETTGEITGTVISSDVLRIRSGAGGSYSIVGYLNPGAKVTITGKKTVGNTTWGKVEKGWISLDYVKLDSADDSENNDQGDTSEQPDTTPETTTEITGTVISNDVLRIRSGAGTSYSTVGYLDPGTKVTITDKKTVGSITWGKISNGWISLDYVKLDSTGSNTTEPDFESEEETSSVKTVTAQCLLVRSGPGTDYAVVDYLYKGTKVTVTETKDMGGVQWGKIANGWICLDYTK